MSIEFVGDLSIQDAKELTLLGRKSKRILEFGVGGSTHIFAQCQPEKLVSVETDPVWVTRTKGNLSRISHSNWTKPKFIPYELFKADNTFDLIFVDGIDRLRRDFAIQSWPCLSADGVMVFHDTRRFADFQNAAWIAQMFFSEIQRIEVNAQDSNVTLLYKRKPLAYVNWTETESKPGWAYGYGDMPEGETLWKIES